MSTQEGNIRFVQSANMNDVPEGGGPPSSRYLTSGRSNDIFRDSSEDDHVGGRTKIVKIYSVTTNPDTDALLGSRTIITQLPADPSVSIAMMSMDDSFSKREDIVKRIESGMSPASEFAGYLMNNVSVSMWSIQIFQRPNTNPPALGKPLILVQDEGLPTEKRQRVRPISIDVKKRDFTETVNGQLLDFPGQVADCRLDGPLRFNFDGSPPSRLYGRQADKTLIRETVFSDSGMFYGAWRLAAPTQPDDVWLNLESIFIQLVPNNKTDVPSGRISPTSRRTLRLHDTPRVVEVGVTAHTKRIKVDEVNQSLTYIDRLRPAPAYGTLFVDYYAQNQRYTLYDDGTGNLVGGGAGNVNPLTGDVSIQLKALPDINSNIAYSWGTDIAYTDRKAQGAAVRAPEFSIKLDADADGDQIEPGSFSLKYPSGGQVYTVTADALGNLTGEATGKLDHASRIALVRPKRMPDPGAEFDIDYRLIDVVTEFVTPAVDAAGFAVINTTQQPAAGTLQLSWAAVRTASTTGGGTLTTTNAAKSSDVTYTARPVPEFYEPAPPEVLPVNTPYKPNYIAIHTD